MKLPGTLFAFSLGLAAGLRQAGQQHATKGIQDMVNQVQPAFEKKYGHPPEWSAISYRTQIVPGPNYFVKVKCKCGEGDYVHLKISVDSNGPVELSDVIRAYNSTVLEYF